VKGTELVDQIHDLDGRSFVAWQEPFVEMQVTQDVLDVMRAGGLLVRPSWGGRSCDGEYWRGSPVCLMKPPHPAKNCIRLIGAGGKLLAQYFLDLPKPKEG
jgi:hypothetical protein